MVEFLFQHLKIDIDKHDFIFKHLNSTIHVFFKELEAYQIYCNVQNFYDSPFYESIEEIIRNFKLAVEPDAHIQFFLDFAFDYTQRKSQNSISFLEYWEQKKEKLSLIASNNKNAVQIMTIHKSKGLEFPVVIFPYDLDIYSQISPKVWYDDLDKDLYKGFENILVSSSSKIENTGEYGKKLFNEQQEELELDNFNLLYVTLTRAKEQLYIISENKIVRDRLKLYSHFFIDYLKSLGVWQEDKLVYEFGEKERKSKKEIINSGVEYQKDFISSSWKDHQINIVTNLSTRWNPERNEAIEFGNLIHEIMADIYIESDINSAIDHKINAGLIDEKSRILIAKTLNELVNHERLNKYFQNTGKIITEREILTEDKQIWIPDRLNFNENKVTIIDYKTGKPEKKHERQINNYALSLQNMKYEVEEKLLVYIDKKIEVLEV